MQFDQSAGDNLFDDARLIGKPTHRVDGPLKVSGQGRYAYEPHDVAEGQLVSYAVVSTIAQGRISSMNAELALTSPGLVDVVTTL